MLKINWFCEQGILTTCIMQMPLQAEFLIIPAISLIPDISEFLIILQERELCDMASLGTCTCTCRLVHYASSYTPIDGVAATFGSIFSLHSTTTCISDFRSGYSLQQVRLCWGGSFHSSDCASCLLSVYHLMTLKLQAPPRDIRHGTAVTSEGPQHLPAAQESALLMNPPPPRQIYISQDRVYNLLLPLPEASAACFASHLTCL